MGRSILSKSLTKKSKLPQNAASGSLSKAKSSKLLKSSNLVESPNLGKSSNLVKSPIPLKPLKSSLKSSKPVDSPVKEKSSYLSSDKLKARILKAAKKGGSLLKALSDSTDDYGVVLKRAIATTVAYQRSRMQNNEMDFTDTTGGTVSVLVRLTSPPPYIMAKHKRVQLPYPIYTKPNIRVCVFVRDPAVKLKEIVKRDWQEEEVGGCPAPKVMGLEKLRAMKHFKTKEELAKSYDLFFAESWVVSMLPALLGNAFIKANKMPISFSASPNNFVKVLQANLKCTYVRISQGELFSVRCGFGLDPPKHLFQNAQT